MVVFKILNKVSGQHYVGSCRGDIFERWQLYLQAAEAGLDFPLYHEIRTQGEAQFTIDEVDYAEDISELKEMELLHTVELNARSLRSYKFGLNDDVVKRRRQLKHENAWRDEIPKPSLPITANATEAATIVTKPLIKTAAAKPMPAKSAVIRPALSKPLSETPATPAQPARAATKTPTPRITAKSTVTSPSASPQAAASDTSAELDESLFAESIGMLVRSLNSVEQLNKQQQQAKNQTVALTQALAASDQALQQLQQQQDEAAVKALAAMAAVESSQQANQALLAAHQKAQTSSAAALQALEHSDATAAETQQLQQQLTDLLARLKPKSSKPTKVQAATPVEPPSQERAAEAPAKATRTQSVDVKVATESKPAVALRTQVICRKDAPDQPEKLQVVADEEAKMINQLKQLDQLLDQAAAPSSDSPTEQQDTQQPMATPARAWIAGTDANTEKTSDSAQLLAQNVTTPTVIRRRSRATSRTVITHRDALQPLACDHKRPVNNRKRLSIKAHR